ncbi:MAG: hypothetical protein ACTHJ1_03355 [Bordetella sp.]|uniref:hypothetical protein n=1 Tax=Bordetella sp. TaxID=28081 RepID=UPI003F7CAD67
MNTQVGNIPIGMTPVGIPLVEQTPSSSSSDGVIGGESVRLAPPHPRLSDEARPHRYEPQARRKLDNIDFQLKIGLAPKQDKLRGEALREALPGRDGLVKWMGAGPKDDIKIFGFTLWQRSSDYKAMLGALDDYQKSAERAQNPKLSSTEKQQAVQRMHDKLKALDACAEKYMAGSRNTHKPEVALLRQRIGEELKLAESVLKEAGSLESGWPEHLAPGQALDMRRFAPSLTFAAMSDLAQVGFKFSLDDMPKHYDIPEAKGGLGEVEAERLQKFKGKVDVLQGQAGGDYSPNIALEAKRLTRAEYMDQLLQGHVALAKDWAQQAREHGLTPEQARPYFEARVPIASKFLDGVKELPKDESAKKIGSGGMNAVFSGQYAFFGGGTPGPAVFKPLSSVDPKALEAAPAAMSSGIDPNAPNPMGRNAGMAWLDRRLGLDLLPKIELAKVGGQLNMVMEKAPGSAPEIGQSVNLRLPVAQIAQLKTDEKARQAFLKDHGLEELEFLDNGGVRGLLDVDNPKKIAVVFDYGDAGLRKELTSLQWLDALSGQVDRHRGNYFVQVDESGRFQKLTGIDNDLAFGKNLTDPDADCRAGISGAQLGLPDVIDEGLANQLKSLTPGELREQLGAMVSPAEVDAALARLGKIHEHIAKLEREGMVLKSTADWSREDVGLKLNQADKPCYVSRDAQFCREVIARNQPHVAPQELNR